MFKKESLPKINNRINDYKNKYDVLIKKKIKLN